MWIAQTVPDPAWNLTDYINVEPTTLYYFKAYDFSDYTTGYSVHGYCYDEHKKYLGMANSENTGNATGFDSNKCKRLTTLENTKYIIVEFPKVLDKYNEIMLMQSYSEQYEPYYILKVATKNDVDECLQKAKDYYEWFTANSTRNALEMLGREYRS